MSTCNDCGQDVRFVLLYEEDGKRVWSPPLEVRPLIMSQRMDSYHLEFAYHNCPKRPQAQQAFAQRNPDYWQKNWCPKCGANAGEQCFNLRSSEGERKVKPHDERRRADRSPG